MRHIEDKGIRQLLCKGGEYGCVGAFAELYLSNKITYNWLIFVKNKNDICLYKCYCFRIISKKDGCRKTDIKRALSGWIGNFDIIKQKILVDYNKKKLVYRGKINGEKLRINDGIINIDWGRIRRYKWI